MNIALLGANGQLGSDLREALNGHSLRALTRDDFDVCDPVAMSRSLESSPPGVIVNTTAFHQVDLCETRAEDAFRVNTGAVLDLARMANRLNAKLVHFSTDYVLGGDGQAPLTEESLPVPLSVYAASKLSGEYVVRNVARRHLLIRTCGLYGVAGRVGQGVNFVETMIRKGRRGEPIRVVDDQRVTPTWTRDLARQVRLMLEADLDGLFHATAEGSCSWYEFARTIFELTGIDADLQPTTQEAYSSPARRPRYSVLENARLKSLGLNRMPPWRDALAAYLQERHGTGTPSRARA